MDPGKKSSFGNQTLEGRYANYFKVGYNAFEFVIDFGQSYSESGHKELCTRIVTGPVYAKNLLNTLQRAIDRYKQDFGEIESDGE